MGTKYNLNSGGPVNVRKTEPAPGEVRPSETPDLGGFLFGDARQPGFLGTGQYRAPGYSVDPNAAVIPNAAATRHVLDAGAMMSARREAPTIATGPQDQFRAQQAGLAGALVAQANGQGPSLAQGQLRSATDRNLAQAMAVGQALGANNPGALREIGNQRAAISQQAAADSSQLALQEQMQARNQLGQVLAGARGQDIGLASGQAQLSQQQQEVNDQMVRFYTSAGMSLDQAQQQAALELERLRQGGALQQQQIDAGAYSDAAHRAIGGNLLSGLGTALTMGAI